MQTILLCRKKTYSVKIRNVTFIILYTRKTYFVFKSDLKRLQSNFILPKHQIFYSFRRVGKCLMEFIRLDNYTNNQYYYINFFLISRNSYFYLYHILTYQHTHLTALTTHCNNFQSPSYNVGKCNPCSTMYSKYYVCWYCKFHWRVVACIYISLKITMHI